MTKEEIFSGVLTIEERIIALKQKSITIPEWEKLEKEYDPTMHDIMEESKRPSRKIKGGGIEAVSRIYLGLQELAVKRMSEFMFALNVKRIYNTGDDPVKKEIAKAIEAIYDRNRINTHNLKRARSLFASCEIATFWYPVDGENSLYGFESKTKLRCKTYSPIDGDKLYPLFDNYGDMIAMSVEYSRKEKDDDVMYFETFTDTHRYIWKKGEGNWEEAEAPVSISIGKIPFSYTYRDKPIFAGLTNIVNEIEFTLSRNSDVIAYNSAPVLEIKGEIAGLENKGEERRVWKVSENGGLRYVSWDQATDALKFQVDTLLDLFWLQLQLPNLSFENLKGLIGGMSGEAIKALLTDAHLKVGDESGNFLEFFDRECNIIKAFVGQMNIKWASLVNDISVEHIITPFVQNDEMAEITKLDKATGGKALMSQLDAIKQLGISSDAEATLKQIQEEDRASTENSRIVDVFEGAE